MALEQYLEVEIYEKEVVEVDIIEKEIITVDINVLDIIQDRGWVADTIKSTLIRNEIPTKINATDFTALYEFLTGSLVVFYNGIKELAITEVGTTKFRFPYNTKSDDTIEIEYLRISQ